MSGLDHHAHRLLALWAADCAEHVLWYFEKDHPADNRPRQAIEAARAWVRGELKVSEARKFAFQAHAARDARSQGSIAAARAAGHTAATAHVAGHAKYAAAYAVKAAKDPNAEWEWQLGILPAHLQALHVQTPT